MADYFAVQALDSYPAIDQAQAGEVGVAYGEFTITATVPLLANADLIHMVWLPGRHRVVDAIVQMDDLDAVANFDWNAGLTDDPDGATEDENALIDAETTVGQAAGMVRMRAIEGLLIAPVNNRRRFGIQVDVLPATQQAGTIRMWLMYRASDSRDA
ncbi:MAG: hypothetical protein V3V08_10885 [Nannocystaceae bacterium]